MPKGRPKGFNEQVVLERAMLAFWREGYNGASMSLLLKEMEISRQSLYDTYGDKRALFLQSLRLYCERELSLLTSLLKGQLSAREQLLSVLFHYRSMALEEEPKGCFIVNSLVNMATDDRELSRIINDALEELLQAISGAIQNAMNSGQLSSQLPASVSAKGFLYALIGLAASSKSRRSEEQVDQTLSAIKSSIGLS